MYAHRILAGCQLWVLTCCPLRCSLPAASPLTCYWPFVVSLPHSQTIAAFETSRPVPGSKLLTELKSSVAVACLDRELIPCCVLFVFPCWLQLLCLPMLFLASRERHQTLCSHCVVQNVHETLAIIKTYLTGTSFQLMRNVTADTWVVIFYSDCLLMITNDCLLETLICLLLRKRAAERLGWSSAVTFRMGNRN